MKSIKKIFCIIIIFTMTMRSFAASSADAASFITKEEFDLALSDFNKRLTVFEAGINSKIDSQVSSYLERNGIWNKTTQDHTGATMSKEIVPPAAVKQAENTFYGTDVFGGPWAYVPKTNKRGLLFGSFTWKNKNGTNNNGTRWGWTCQMSSNTTWRSDCGFTLLVSLYEEVNGVKNLSYVYPLFSSPGTLWATKGSDVGAMVVAPLSTSEVAIPFQIFVGKDSKVWWECKVIYHFYFTTSVTPQTGATSTLVLNMKNADVY